MATLAERQPPAAARLSPAPAPARRGPWSHVRRVFTYAFFALVLWLVVTQARAIAWDEVWGSVQALPLSALLGGAALAAASHALYSTFDLFGRHVTGHRLGTGQVMLVTAISYAFNLNLGALVGGFAFRYRLYHRLGLDNTTVTSILTMSMLTNWLGYIVLGGGVFLFGSLTLPPDWKIGTDGLHWLGAGLLAAAAAYLAACGLSRRRSFTVRGHEVTLPSLRLALLQMLVSCTNWLLIAGVVFTLLQQRVEFPLVLGVLLIAAVAGVITHVPAGIGVLEAVFVALLSHLVPKGDLLGALLAYRALYYLAPLTLAVLAYLLVEARAKALRTTQPSPR